MCGMWFDVCVPVGSNLCRRNFLLGIAHLVVRPLFRYRGCTGRGCSNETMIMKEADVWP